MSKILTLDLVPENSKVKVVSIDAGYGLQRRLIDMGLVPGVEISVISNRGGSIIINVMGSTIAISRGIAKKIIVELI